METRLTVRTAMPVPVNQCQDPYSIPFLYGIGGRALVRLSDFNESQTLKSREVRNLGRHDVCSSQVKSYD